MEAARQKAEQARKDGNDSFANVDFLGERSHCFGKFKAKQKRNRFRRFEETG